MIMDIQRIGSLIGCLSSIVFTLSWSLSALLWGDWVLGSNSLSDIGICGVESAEFVFNMGCIVTGILVFFLALALIRDNDRWFRLSGYTAFVSGVACLLVGIVTEDHNDLHNIVAGTYGAFAAATIALSAIGDYVEGRRWLTFIAAAMLILCGISSIVHPFGVFEPIGVSCILIWTFILSATLYIKNVKKGVSADDH